MKKNFRWIRKPVFVLVKRMPLAKEYHQLYFYFKPCYQLIWWHLFQELLNRLMQDHGSMDLEWLRDVPPEKAK